MLILFEIALATFAVTYVLKFTDGPWDAFWYFRRWIGIQWQFDGDQEIEEYLDEDAGFWANLVQCWWCLSTWVALGWTILAVVLLGLSLAEAPFYWFASVALAGLVKKVVD